MTRRANSDFWRNSDDEIEEPAAGGTQVERARSGSSEELVFIRNPLSPALSAVGRLLSGLHWSPPMIVPSAFVAVVMSVVFVAMVLLWPYGWMPVIAHLLWGLVKTARRQIKNAKSLAERMPFTVALGIYLLIWTPFAVICAPLYLIGWIGESIASIE
ncbi:MAG: hypothetical protein HYV07_14120 [Deltaproteobacteria bacterium]|nr:hypothetical protein [Deltaproteobacteria bacterium]